MGKTVPLQPVGFVMCWLSFCFLCHVCCCFLLFYVCCLLLVRICCLLDCLRWVVCSFVVFWCLLLFLGPFCSVLYVCFVLNGFKQQFAIYQPRKHTHKTKQTKLFRFHQGCPPKVSGVGCFSRSVQVSPPFSGGTAMDNTVPLQPVGFVLCGPLFCIISRLLLFSFVLCLLSFACSSVLFV